MLFLLLGLFFACRNDKLWQTEKIVSTLRSYLDVTAPGTGFRLIHLARHHSILVQTVLQHRYRPAVEIKAGEDSYGNVAQFLQPFFLRDHSAGQLPLLAVAFSPFRLFPLSFPRATSQLSGQCVPLPTGRTVRQNRTGPARWEARVVAVAADRAPAPPLKRPLPARSLGPARPSAGPQAKPSC